MTPPPEAPDTAETGEITAEFRAQLRAATDVLARVDADRSLLVPLPAHERQQFLDLVAKVFHPHDVLTVAEVAAALTAQGLK